MINHLELPGREKPYVMAHRGNLVACPENTMASFRRALQDGADILETDLQISVDENLICIHDGTVDRTTDGHGLVEDLSLEELKKLRASYGRPEFEQETIPILEEVADILPSDVALALELKSDRFLERGTCEILLTKLEQSNVRDRTLLLSFSEKRLETFRSIDPSIPLGWIHMNRLWPRSEFQMLGPFWPLLFLNPFFVRIARSRGQLICPLDPTPEPRLWYYRWLGCDAVLSDDPGKTCRALGRVSRGSPQAM